MKLKGRKVLVVGAGKSGVAAARFLKQKGATVTLADIKPAAELAEATNAGIATFFGGYPEPGEYDLLVVSPGVPLTVAPVTQALNLGIEVIGEVELAYRFARAPIVAITGTNGKTTTTALTGEIFKTAGRRTLVAGNIGTPLVAAVENYGPEDIIVAEISSFQLETTHSFHPRVAVVLNVACDHLDRHHTIAEYAASKARIFANQEEEDAAVLNLDDPIVAAMEDSTRASVLFFSRQNSLDTGAFVHADRVVVRQNGVLTEICGAREIGIPGMHNLENALAATAAATFLGVPGSVVGRVLRNFTGVAHRLEFVGEVGGVRYINDSKGTNPDAAIKALESYSEPIVLIAGGRNKGSDFSAFAAKLKEKVRTLIVLGECAAEIAAAAQAAGVKDIIYAKDLRDAVFQARDAAVPGDVVLLSPACASWDMFKNYEERGDLFKQIVREIAASAKG
ncbi:MAG: UDP-N-acetylmuramoyl-L-alanine--D-glutamate ligase [Bacillota bacterium]